MSRVTPSGHGLGWIRDDLDTRDLLFAARPEIALNLPPAVDLRPKMPPVVDQGQLGSCTGNAWAGAFDYERGRQGLPFITPSRLFIYYNERVIEGTVAADSGAQIRDGIKTLATQGVCPESEWPYVISQFAVQPPTKDFTDALGDMVAQYMSVPLNAQQMMGALAQGLAIVIGFTVYPGYEQVGADGMIPTPRHGEKPLGGHANVVVGYDTARQVWITRNSWGTGWGDGGYAYFPMAYLTNPRLANDFWTAQLVKATT